MKRLFFAQVDTKRGKRLLLIILEESRIACFKHIYGEAAGSDCILLRLSEDEVDRDGVPYGGDPEIWIWNGKKWNSL